MPAASMRCLIGRNRCVDSEPSLPEEESSTLQGRACLDLAATALVAAPVREVCLRRLLPSEAEAAEAEVLEAVLLLAVLLLAVLLPAFLQVEQLMGAFLSRTCFPRCG